MNWKSELGLANGRSDPSALCPCDCFLEFVGDAGVARPRRFFSLNKGGRRAVQPRRAPRHLPPIQCTIHMRIEFGTDPMRLLGDPAGAITCTMIYLLYHGLAKMFTTIQNDHRSLCALGELHASNPRWQKLKHVSRQIPQACVCHACRRKTMADGPNWVEHLKLPLHAVKLPCEGRMVGLAQVTYDKWNRRRHPPAPRRHCQCAGAWPGATQGAASAA